MRRTFLACLVVLAVLPAAIAVAAESDISIALRPDRAGRASTAVLHAPGTALGGRIPSSLVLSIQRGFGLDPRSRAVACSPSDADNSTCPAASHIGTGTLVVTVQGPLVPTAQDVTIQLEAYLGRRERRGDVAGLVLTARQQQFGIVRSVRGRLVRLRRGAFGYQARFDRLPSFTPPAGYTFTAKSLDLTLGASRRVRRHRYALITNPRRCAGTWHANLSLGYSDGTSRQASIMTPCHA